MITGRKGRRAIVCTALLVPCFAGAAGVCRAQTLETETARLLTAGSWKLGGAYEFQHSSDGSEGAFPFLAEYGIRDNLEFAVEPVPYTAIRPATGAGATGGGDTEATLTWQFRQESGRLPAMAVAGEVKFATARNTQIGTRQTDYAVYFIASKRFGKVDGHVNVAYTFVGDPPGAHLRNIYNFALAGVYRPTPTVDIFAEVLRNTSSLPGGESGDAKTSVIPEAAGGETVGTVGAGRRIRENLLLYVAVSYDNNGALQVRPGFTLRIH
ncbi:MAG TPA: hypothetical protein VE404_08265 [Verrucomicrobiae bacterium]|nr:hypothetical protein [Verrucomicrobiae bacterium]